MLESELFRMFERTTDAAFSVDQEGKICSWNKAAERLFGYPASDAISATCRDLLDGLGPLGTPVWPALSSISERGGDSIPNFDMSVKTRSGRRIWINMSTVEFTNSRTGRCLLIHLAHDITDQKRAEELVRRMLDLSKELLEVESTVRAAPIPSLSDQERQVLKLFAEGKDSGDVAHRLGITAQTLRNHLHHINQKLRTHNRLEAVMNAIQRKLV
jgi:PAS domain S-box-containing protein